MKAQLIEDPQSIVDAACEDLLGDRARLAIAKLFPGHLDTDQLRTIISKVDGLIVLWRNPLYSWLSDSIATKNNQWAHSNTESTSVNWNFRHFVQSTAYNLNFIDECLNFASQAHLPTLELEYNALLDAGKSKELLWEWLIEFNFLMESNSVQELPYSASFSKQDKRQAIDRIRSADRITLEYDLNEMGLLGILEEDMSLSRRAIVERLVDI